MGRRHLDAGDHDRAGVEPIPAVVVVRHGESVEAPAAGHRSQQSRTKRVERGRTRLEAVEETGVGVEVDDEHGLHNGAEALLRLLPLVTYVTPSADSPPATHRRILVHNPASGNADHDELIRTLAEERRYEVRETESAEDIVVKAAEAAREAGIVAAAGGDGTLTRAVRGLDSADAFDDTLFGVIPTGTGNNFAGNVGITGVEHGFDVIDHGERRRIDLGVADGTCFLNSCVAGVTAEASADTDAEEKKRWGSLAYAMTTARTLREFDNLHLTVEPESEPTWECDAKIVFVGNARGFPRTGRSQAHVEDGLLDVTVIEDVSTVGLLEESLQTALGDNPEHVTQFLTPRLDIDLGGKSSQISIDGEILAASKLTFGVRERTLWLPVGEAYEPTPQTATSEE